MAIKLDEEIQKKHGKKKTKKQKELIKFTDEDLDNFHYVARRGGYLEQTNYVLVNNKYVCSMRAISYPKNGVQDLFLIGFQTMPGVSIKIDVDEKDLTTVKSDIDRNIEKREAKRALARKTTDIMDAERDMQENMNFYEKIKSGAESLKKITLNFMLEAESIEALQRLVDDIQGKLAPFDIDATINKNDQCDEIKLLKYRNTIETVMPSSTFTSFYNFDFEEHIDPRGFLLGSTETGGNVIMNHTLAADYDAKALRENRTTHDVILQGKSGSGKSTLTKSIIMKEYLAGNIIYILDPEREYTKMTRELGGKILDISEQRINPMEYRSDNNDLKIEEKEFTNEDGTIEIREVESTGEAFSNHLDNLERLFSILGDFDSNELNIIKIYLRYFYASWKNPITKETDTSSWSSRDFPLLGDFDKVLEAIIYRPDSVDFRLLDEHRGALSKLHNMLHNVTINNEKYFNSYSTFEIMDSNLITFSTKKLDKVSAKVKTALIFNFLENFVSKRIEENDRENQKFLQNGGSMEDRTFFRLVLDEAHLLFKSELFVEFLVNAAKRNRKYYAGTLYISQSMRDFFPEVVTEKSENLKRVFTQSTYKYLGFQDGIDGDMVAETFSSIITKMDTARLDKMGLGEFISILGDKKITMKNLVHEKELELFQKEMD